MTQRDSLPPRQAAGINYDQRATMPVLSTLKFHVIVYGATARDLMMIGPPEHCPMAQPVHRAAARLGLKMGDYAPNLFGIKDVENEWLR